MICADNQKTGRFQSPRRSRCRWRLWVLTAVLWLACATPVASAASILVALSTEADPYKQAYMAMREHLVKQNHHVAFVRLEDLLKDKDKYLTDQIDAVVGVGTQAAVWLHRNAGESVVLTYCMVASPEDVGLTKGRSANGVTTQIALSEQFHFISRVLPKARSVGMIYNAESEKSKLLYERVAKSMPDTWKLRAIAKSEDKSVAETIEELFKGNVDVVWTAPDSSVYDIPTVRTMLLSAMRHKTPVFGFSPQFVRAGALFGVGVSPADQGQQAARIVLGELAKRAANGSDNGNGEREPESPKFETAVNLIVAEKLDMDLPRKIVREAKYVWPEPKDGEKD